MDCEKFRISKIFESEPDRTSKSLKILNQVGLVAPGPSGPWIPAGLFENHAILLNDLTLTLTKLHSYSKGLEIILLQIDTFSNQKLCCFSQLFCFQVKQ